MAENFISEWFGQRMYPRVVSSPEALRIQAQRLCPFLSAVKEEDKECIKPDNARGVCSISSASNGSRQDWVTCPYRAFDPALMRGIATKLYGFSKSTKLTIVSAPDLSETDRAAELLARLRSKERVLVYFDNKMGGEIQVAATRASPQISFDTTFVELLLGSDGAFTLGRFAIVEIQTMDFHGTYKHAVENLFQALRLHKGEFPSAVEAHQDWLGEEIEGPNIANVFKRTYYQLLFKFEIGNTPQCAGTVLAIPAAVWDSWQRFLGQPQLKRTGAGTWSLSRGVGSIEGEARS